MKKIFMYAVCCSLDWCLKLRVNTILRGILTVAYLLHLMLKKFKFSTPEAFVVVVVLLFYVHGKHLRSCRDGQLT